jgi:hypothetical protein
VVAAFTLPIDEERLVQLSEGPDSVLHPASLPKLDKEITDRETEEKKLGSQISAESAERRADAVKAAAAATNLKTGLASEVTQRNKAIDEQIAANVDAKKAIAKATQTEAADKAAQDSATQKLDAAIGGEVKNREQAIKQTQSAIAGMKTAQQTALQETRKGLNKQQAKLTNDLVAKDKLLEGAVKANSDAIKREESARAKEAKNDQQLFATMKSKIDTLEGALRKVTNGQPQQPGSAAAPKPATPAATPAPPAAAAAAPPPPPATEW